MTLLVRHPDTPPGAIQAIDAELVRMAGGAVATFRVAGDMARLAVPPPADPVRTDELWQTTCFELFVAGAGPAYREFNLSPSGAWAAWQFDDYRAGMAEAAAAISIETDISSKGLLLVANIMCELEDPVRVGLTAVIEETDGVIRYWSTAFAPGKPDFHAAAVRSLLFDGVGTD